MEESILADLDDLSEDLNDTQSRTQTVELCLPISTVNN